LPVLRTGVPGATVEDDEAEELEDVVGEELVVDGYGAGKDMVVDEDEVEDDAEDDMLLENDGEVVCRVEDNRLVLELSELTGIVDTEVGNWELLKADSSELRYEEKLITVVGITLPGSAVVAVIVEAIEMLDRVVEVRLC
jgi:hypothetical protein